MDVTDRALEGDRLLAVDMRKDAASGERRHFAGDYFFSTMPVKELSALDAPATR